MRLMSETTLERERIVESIARLRKIVPELSDEARAHIDSVISFLEDAAGPTVTRSEASRLLGVSHTTINRWIKKGDITTVPTTRGRSEISRGQVIRFLEALEENSTQPGSLALAQVIHDQRQRAAKLNVASLVPAGRSHSAGHRKTELRSLAYHSAVARRLDKEIVADAKHLLHRWQREARIHPQWAGEWDRILAMPIRKIALTLSSDTEHSHALRQTSPFAGVLTEQERRRVLEGVEELTQ